MDAGQGHTGDDRGEAGDGHDPPADPDAIGPPAVPGVLDGGGLTARLEAWAGESRVAEAARRRERERWLRQAAEEGATLRGVLADLAEQGTWVVVRASSGRPHRGRARSLGADHVVLATGTGDVVVALGAVSSVRTCPGEPAPVGDRPAPGRRRMADLLAELAAEREPAAVVTRDGAETVVGTIRSVGRDLLVVRAAGDRSTAYLPLDAVGEVVLGAGPAGPTP